LTIRSGSGAGDPRDSLLQLFFVEHNLQLTQESGNLQDIGNLLLRGQQEQPLPLPFQAGADRQQEADTHGGDVCHFGHVNDRVAIERDRQGRHANRNLRLTLRIKLAQESQPDRLTFDLFNDLQFQHGGFLAVNC
jgi:hypothetical protein